MKNVWNVTNAGRILIGLIGKIHVNLAGMGIVMIVEKMIATHAGMNVWKRQDLAKKNAGQANAENAKCNAMTSVNLHVDVRNAGKLMIGEDGKILANTVNKIHHAGIFVNQQVKNVTIVGKLLTGKTGRTHVNLAMTQNGVVNAGKPVRNLAKILVLNHYVMIALRIITIVGWIVIGMAHVMKFVMIGGLTVIGAGEKLNVMISVATKPSKGVKNAGTIQTLKILAVVGKII